MDSCRSKKRNLLNLIDLPKERNDWNKTISDTDILYVLVKFKTAGESISLFGCTDFGQIPDPWKTRIPGLPPLTQLPVIAL